MKNITLEKTIAEGHELLGGLRVAYLEICCLLIANELRLKTRSCAQPYNRNTITPYLEKLAQEIKTQQTIIKD
jgi:hypothetical protein